MTSPPPPLIDGFGRVANDLRISVTDRCNFRCTYCMPAEGLAWLPKSDVLTFEEMTRLAGIFISLGINALKITGGEPTVRAELPTLIASLREIADPDIDISMTSNGMTLDRAAQPLADAGLSRVSVSCDSLLRHRFEEMTRRDALDAVFAGIEAADAAGLQPVKINCVVIGGTNDDEVVSFAEWSRRTGHHVRFIEYMPLDADHAWERDKVVASSAVIARINDVFPLQAQAHGAEPAAAFAFADGAPGGIGVISSVTAPFCDTCNRLRITAEGSFRTCLFALEEVDLRGPLRSGASDDAIAELIRAAVSRKWAGHRINLPDFTRPDKSMSMIGG